MARDVPLRLAPGIGDGLATGVARDQALGDPVAVVGRNQKVSSRDGDEALLLFGRRVREAPEGTRQCPTRAWRYARRMEDLIVH